MLKIELNAGYPLLLLKSDNNLTETSYSAFNNFKQTRIERSFAPWHDRR